MEFRKVDDIPYGKLKEYTDEVLKVVPELNHLRLVDYNGKTMLLSQYEEQVGVAQKENGKVQPYLLNTNSNLVEIFSTLRYHYEILDSTHKEVLRTDCIFAKDAKLYYLPRIENNPRDVITFVERIGDDPITLTQSYDVTIRDNIESAFAYCLYHFPDNLVLEEFKRFLLAAYNKTSCYAIDLNNPDQYFSPLLTLGGHFLFPRMKTLDAENLMNSMEELGFSKEIPSDMSSLISGTNKTYNDLKLVTNEYKKSLKKELKQQ